MKRNELTNNKDNESFEEYTKNSYLYQYFVAFSVTLAVFANDTALGWASPAIPKLLAEDSPIPITLDESSWIISFRSIGNLLCAIPTIFMLDRLGRKYTMLIGSIPLLIGWIMIGFAESVTGLYVARILVGYSYSLIYSVTPMYLGEISSDAIRGSISIMLTIMAKAGILYVYSIGPYVSFRLLTWLSLIPLLVFFCTFIWSPESPYHLLSKNRDEDAYKSLSRLRKSKDVHDELNRMSIAVKKSQENKGTFKELFKRGNFRGLIIIIGLGAAQQLSGSQAILAYSHRIFEAVGSDLGASEASIILAVIQLIAAVSSSLLVDRWGRRPLLLISMFFVAICNTIIGVYFLLQRLFDVRHFSWIPMASLMLFFIFYNFGLAPVPFAILGEIFPKHLKLFIVIIRIIVIGCIAFIVSKLFQVVSDELGSDYTFLGFATFSFFFFGFAYFLVPETKQKSLDTILELMKT